MSGFDGAVGEALLVGLFDLSLWIPAYRAGSGSARNHRCCATVVWDDTWSTASPYV